MIYWRPLWESAYFSPGGIDRRRLDLYKILMENHTSYVAPYKHGPEMRIPQLHKIEINLPEIYFLARM